MPVNDNPGMGLIITVIWCFSRENIFNYKMTGQLKSKKGNTSPSLVNAAECQPPAAMSTCKQM
jgi:hypothetical protein